MDNKQQAKEWFYSLRDQYIAYFEAIEQEMAKQKGADAAVFTKKDWQRAGGGGGTMGLMHGEVFEKAGVNVSTVYGEFSEEFRRKIPGTEESANFTATGISVVIHPRSPLVPAMHFNTRYIETAKYWFGGGGDMTPIFEELEDTRTFHGALKEVCDKHNPDYYPRFKKQCDEYFYLPHRKEARGVGGIFYDYLNTNFADDFSFTQDVGRAVLAAYLQIVRANMHKTWSAEQKEAQLIKRGRYVEFNLLYDRGTQFGLATGGNTEAILMSLPPEVKWP